MERIGIYGGTFNPPHAGHIQAAKQAVTALNLDKLVIVPTILVGTITSLSRFSAVTACFAA